MRPRVAWSVEMNCHNLNGISVTVGGRPNQVTHPMRSGPLNIFNVRENENAGMSGKLICCLLKVCHHILLTETLVQLYNQGKPFTQQTK